MSLSHQEAVAQVTSPGQMFELAPWTRPDGVTYDVFTHAPPSMRELFALARAHGDATFLVYEDERRTFAETIAEVDALARRPRRALRRAEGRPRRHRHAQLPRVGHGLRRDHLDRRDLASRSTRGGPRTSWTRPRGLGRHGADRRRASGRARSAAASRSGWVPGSSWCGAAARRPRASTGGRTSSSPGAPLPDVDDRSGRRRDDPLHLGHDRRPKGAVSTHRAVIHGAAGLRLPRGWSTALRRARRGRPTPAGPRGVHPGRAAVPRHRLRGGDAVVLRRPA